MSCIFEYWLSQACFDLQDEIETDYMQETTLQRNKFSQTSVMILLIQKCLIIDRHLACLGPDDLEFNWQRFRASKSQNAARL